MKKIWLGGIAVLLCVSLFSLGFAACDDSSDSDDDDEGDEALYSGTTVGGPGGVITYGATYLEENISLATDVPLTLSFTVHNASDVRIDYWGINDITDQDTLTYHDGTMAIDYDDMGKAFSIEAGKTFPFTVTLADAAGGPAVASGETYQMEVAIQNKNDVTPNPFIFKVRLSVVP